MTKYERLALFSTGAYILSGLALAVANLAGLQAPLVSVIGFGYGFSMVVLVRALYGVYRERREEDFSVTGIEQRRHP